MTAHVDDKVLFQARFTFPFRLSLQSVAFAFQYDGSLTSVSMRSFLGKQILVLAEGSAAPGTESSILRARHPTPHEVDNREVKVRSGAARFLEEVRDTVGFTRMDIAFEVGANAIEDESNRRIHATDALQRAQYVIRVYRALSQEPDVMIPQEGDSPIVELAVSDSYTFCEDETAGHFRVVAQEFHWNNPETTGILKQHMGPAAQTALLEHLRGPTGPELYRELLVEAKSLSKLRSSHALAIVVMGAGLEAYVRSRLRLECGIRGVAELTDDRGITKGADEAIQDGDLKRDLLGKYAETLLGQPLKSSAAYSKWHQDSYAKTGYRTQRSDANHT